MLQQVRGQARLLLGLVGDDEPVPELLPIMIADQGKGSHELLLDWSVVVVAMCKQGRGPDTRICRPDWIHFHWGTPIKVVG